MFKILKESSRSNARLGVIETPHGIIETPAYTIVGTHAEVRCLTPLDLEATKTQLIIANTYHLWRELGDEGLASYPGLHEAMGWSHPIMTDSGGFQVFSLGVAREQGIGKVKKLNETVNWPGDNLVRVTDSGVYFMEDGEEQYLDAELSMRIQEQLGADIIVAFDEPTSPLHDHEYTKQSLIRTHRWAERSLEAKVSKQLIYGVIQGGAFPDLRKESAEFIGALPFDGFAIGGAFGDSFGSKKTQMLTELESSIPYLPKDRPRHLLGIGRVEDLFLGVEAGIDTFDCVIPTREARHGSVWTRQGRFDLKKSIFEDDDRPLDEACDCPVCLSGDVNRHTLRKLFKDKNPRAGELATVHNVYFFNNLMAEIREAIKNDSLGELKKQYLEKGNETEPLSE
ncbi:MAG: tRNA guanosine(34) transglycosylase Tgt [Patescibacteria group bacterium]